MSENTEAVAAFKKAWHAADTDGFDGQRTVAGIAAAEKVIRENIYIELMGQATDAWNGGPDWARYGNGMAEAARIARGEAYV